MPFEIHNLIQVLPVAEQNNLYISGGLYNL